MHDFFDIYFERIEINKQVIMAEDLEIKELSDVAVRFSGDSGDGMQLAGNIFSTVSATVGIQRTSVPLKVH